MGTRADVPCINPTGYSSDEDPLLSLVEVICGCPVTADADKSPFQNRPEDLSTEISWYLVCSEVTRVFRERNNRETSGMMLEYTITTNQGTFSICRIWQDPPDHAQVGGRFPFDDNPHHPDDYPVLSAGNLPESDIFSGGDFLELLDLEVPLFPSSNSETLS